MNERRREAARRVAALHPPLAEVFAELRASLGESPAPPAPVVPVAADSLAAALTAGLADVATGDADELALALALAAEEPVREYVAAGAQAARAAGVPGDADVGDAATDALLGVLQAYAAGIVAGTEVPPPSPELLDRLRGVARSAGVVAAVDGTSWIARRFGSTTCPRPACFGRDGSLLTADRIATEGLPPYGDGCTCVAEATPG